MYSDVDLIMVIAAILEDAISYETRQASDTESSAYKAQLLLQV